MMPADLKELLHALNAHGVKFLVVGGYAFGAYTEPRATKDPDIFIRSDEENSEAIYRALADFGAPLHDLSPADFRDGTCFQIGSPPARIDILQQSTESLSTRPGRTAWKHPSKGKSGLPSFPVRTSSATSSPPGESRIGST